MQHALNLLNKKSTQAFCNAAFYNKLLKFPTPGAQMPRTLHNYNIYSSEQKSQPCVQIHLVHKNICTVYGHTKFLRLFSNTKYLAIVFSWPWVRITKWVLGLTVMESGYENNR